MDLETSTAIESLRHDLGRQIAATENALSGEMRELRDELARKMMVLTESVRDDIRIVAEGLAAVSAKIDGLRR